MWDLATRLSVLLVGDGSVADINVLAVYLEDGIPAKATIEMSAAQAKGRRLQDHPPAMQETMASLRPP